MYKLEIYLIIIGFVLIAISMIASWWISTIKFTRWISVLGLTSIIIGLIGLIFNYFNY